jgi:hypothetical protein
MTAHFPVWTGASLKSGGDLTSIMSQKVLDVYMFIDYKSSMYTNGVILLSIVQC